MAFLMDDNAVGGQLFVGAGQPGALGVGSNKIRGSAFVEGPLQIGPAGAYGNVQATVMIGKLANPDASKPQYSLWVKNDSRFQSNVRIDSLCKTNRIESKTGRIDSIRGNSLRYGSKSFLIDHPTKPGMKLEYGCLEGPEHSVYCRGKVLNRDYIELPQEWTGLVDETTITVSLTPIGAHQDIIVKRMDENKVYLQSKGGMPIHCFYHIFGTRKDIPKLVTEYYEEENT
jgi:hypothetical protein